MVAGNGADLDQHHVWIKGKRMTKIIENLTYDDVFVDNILLPNPHEIDINTDPCIKFTALVIDETTKAPQSNVTIQWSASRDAVQFFNTNGIYLDTADHNNQTTTNADGIAQVYVACWKPALTQIFAEIDPDDGGGPATKTVVFCTIKPYPTTSTDPSPPTMEAGTAIAIPSGPDADYSSPALVRSVGTINAKDWAVAWIATFDDKNNLMDRHILTPIGLTYGTLYKNGFTVPYDYMVTQNKYTNFIQYLVSHRTGGSAAASNWSRFTATGVAYAKPDPSRQINSQYPPPFYVDWNGIPQPSKSVIKEDDFVKNIQNSYVLNFQIKSANEIEADDFIDIYLYINGYEYKSDARNSGVVFLGSHRYGDLENGIFSIRKSLVSQYCQSLWDDPGSLLLTYQVNNAAWSSSKFWRTEFTGDWSRKANRMSA